MATRWIDFTALKKAVSIVDVLGHYGHLEGLRETKPGKLVGPCPLHGGTNNTSFNVDAERGIWNCFSGCKADGKSGGNVLDLVMRMEGCEIRQAGEKLCDLFGLTFERNGNPGQNSAKVSEKKRPVDSETGSKGESPSSPVSRRADPKVNPPLARALTLKTDHPYLVERGVTKPTIETFEIGFCNRGMMRGRIAIPIHDGEGTLVAYAGRWVGPDDTIPDNEGKYKLPSKEKNGFHKSRLLFNLHRAIASDRTWCVIVEGFFDALRVHRAGFENVVALMGSTLTAEQAALLEAHFERLVLVFDGDSAGTEGERLVYRMLRTRMFLKSIHLTEGEEPDTLSDDRIRDLLS